MMKEFSSIYRDGWNLDRRGAERERDLEMKVSDIYLIIRDSITSDNGGSHYITELWLSAFIEMSVV